MTDENLNREPTESADSARVAEAIAPTGPLGRLAAAGWPTVLVAGAFALLFAYEVWQGVALLITPTATVEYLKILSMPLAVAVLVLGILIPVIVYAFALWFARDRPLWTLALTLLTGLFLVPMLTLSVTTVGFRIAMAIAS